MERCEVCRCMVPTLTLGHLLLCWGLGWYELTTSRNQSFGIHQIPVCEFCRGTADESNLHRDLQRDLRYPGQWGADFYWEITEKPLGWIGIPNTKLCQSFNRSLTSFHKSTTFQWGLYPAVCLLCSEECEHGGHCEEKMWGKLPITSEPEGKVTLELTGNTNH